MDRKMASVQKIVDLKHIEGADKIEVATVLGWNVVVRKGLFKVGDLVIYCEPDSLIPFTPWSEFLFKNGRTGNFRLKTIRLRGQISQGLVLPLTVFGGTIQDYYFKTSKGTYDIYSLYGSFSEGDDVSERLNITKYEPEMPANLRGICKSTFPQWIPKTDETRIQSIPDILQRQRGAWVYVTEKVDGCSMTVYYKDNEFGVCSRNMDLKETDDNQYWKTARDLKLKERLEAFYKGQRRQIALQGELCGPGIQGNKYNLTEHKFLIFNVYDIDKNKYANFEEFIIIVGALGLEPVPFDCKFVLAFDSVDAIVKFSKGNSNLNKDVMREGIVIRPVREEQDEKIGRFSFKVINPEFLIKHGE